mmetsp:Transcript_32313/g.75907  ORF Transcript_32313/g.75907 Transcript_32313/m.75907 type:complete len:225 (+) Transcript_32313:1230-1904(+)
MASAKICRACAMEKLCFFSPSSFWMICFKFCTVMIHLLAFSFALAAALSSFAMLFLGVMEPLEMVFALTSSTSSSLSSTWPFLLSASSFFTAARMAPMFAASPFMYSLHLLYALTPSRQRVSVCPICSTTSLYASMTIAMSMFNKMMEIRRLKGMNQKDASKRPTSFNSSHSKSPSMARKQDVNDRDVVVKSGLSLPKRTTAAMAYMMNTEEQMIRKCAKSMDE